MIQHSLVRSDRGNYCGNSKTVRRGASLFWRWRSVGGVSRSDGRARPAASICRGSRLRHTGVVSVVAMFWLLIEGLGNQSRDARQQLCRLVNFVSSGSLIYCVCAQVQLSRPKVALFMSMHDLYRNKTPALIV